MFEGAWNLYPSDELYLESTTMKKEDHCTNTRRFICLGEGEEINETGTGVAACQVNIIKSLLPNQRLA